jgi:preprotein translocase subunit SecE
MKLEETKTQEVSKPEGKKDNKPKDKKGFSFSDWFAAHKAEFRKIVWPTKQEIVRETAIVLVLCFLIGAIIFGMDEVISYGYNALVSLVTKA